MHDEAGNPGKPRRTTVTRRALVQRIGATGSGLWVLGSAGLLQPDTTLAALVTQAYSAGLVSLEVDGGLTALRAVEGGNVGADVLADAGPPDQPIGKRLGANRVDDIVLKMPFDVAPGLASWISETLGKGPTTRSGAIVYTDVNLTERKRMSFSNAIISEVALPVCDVLTAKTAPQITLRLTPEATQLQGGSGKPLQGSIGGLGKAAGGIFRLNIQGLESATVFVSKIEGLGAKRVTAASMIGQIRGKQMQVGALDVQPIRIQLPENRAAPFYSWFESFVIKGTGAAGVDERPGLLEWLSPNLLTVVASVQLQNLGIFGYAPDPYTGGADTVPKVQIDLYCERLSLSL